RTTCPGAAKARHAMLNVEEETLALLLSVVAYVDAGCGLLRHDLPQRVAACTLQLGGIHRTALRAAAIEAHQLQRPRQAAGMRRQDPILAHPHVAILLSRELR